MARNRDERQIIQDQFVEALQKEYKLRLTSIDGPNAQPLIGDVFTSRLLSFASSDDLDAKRAAVIAVAEILKVILPDPKLAIRLATALCKVVPCSDAQLVRETAVLFASMIPLEGMSRLADVQIPQFLEWLRGERLAFSQCFLLTACSDRRPQ
jgi:hypothetical protein